ncbi:MAG: nucleotidyltransferase domain-containing protein [Candidatus Micrarchaeota archaeon]
MQTLKAMNKRNKIILRYILKNENQVIIIRKVAKKLKINVASVSIFIRKLKKSGIVRGNSVDGDNPYTRAWKFLLNIEELLPYINRITHGLDALGIGVYGSWVKGTNNENSDVDFWVKVNSEPNEIHIARMRAKIRRWIGTEPSFMFITDKKLRELEKNNKQLYFALVNSYHLGGEWLD